MIISLVVQSKSGFNGISDAIALVLSFGKRQEAEGGFGIQRLSSLIPIPTCRRLKGLRTAVFQDNKGS